MKILDIPKSGKCGTVVVYASRFGLCQRIYTVPSPRKTPARDHMHGVFGSHGQGWGGRLTQAQRDRWDVEAAKVWSHPRCGTRGRLTGEQFYTGINSVLGCVGLPPLWEPPARVVFNLSVVRELVITSDESGVRLFLRLAGPPTEDIMVFGQAPCSAGRSKRRNVSYLGLLPPAVDGLSEITDLYKAKHGEPRPGTKVFIVTCQQKNGWKGMEQESSEVVPAGPAKHAKDAKGEDQEARGVVPAGAEGEQAAATLSSGLKPLMYKGCTRGAQGSGAPVEPGVREDTEGGSQGGKAAGAGLEGRAGPGGEGDAPV